MTTSGGERREASSLGVRSALGDVSQRAPRRVGQWAAAILFVAVVVVALVAVFQSQSDRIEVLVVRNAVPAGQVVQPSDLGSARVAGAPGAVPASDVETVAGLRAAVSLVEGQVLTDSSLTDAMVPGAGERLVAIRLDRGRVPGGLAPGDLVDVLAVPPDGDLGSEAQLDAPPRLARAARVDSVGETPDSALVVTVLVRETEADTIAARSAVGQVTIVQAPAEG